MALVLALTCIAAAGLCLWLAFRPFGLLRQQAAPSSVAAVAATGPAVTTPSPSKAAAIEGSRPNWLKVRSFDELLQLVDADKALGHMYRESRLARNTWERDLLPAIHRYAELVQMMPASEAHHHAHAGGLLAHTLEMVLAAMRWRNGCQLPQGASAEILDSQRDFWTYAVFFGALLHDVGKTIADLRIEWVRPGTTKAFRWTPVAGTLVECGAGEYHVGFTPKAERDYGAHGRLAVMLLQRLAPASALSFLGRDQQAIEAMTQYLSGNDRDGPLAQLVGRADQASTKRALAQGSRARFATATAQPLIELLMGAMRDLLRRGGQLPLNRDGAVGWVYGDSVWFVAKRLADQVREHLKQHAPDEAVPGEAKNDRLFDTWQEYGALMPNPQSQQAIWYVKVHGEDGGGYSHQLTMLRFPLHKLWDDPDTYPAPMAGRIEVLPKRIPAEQAQPADDLEQQQDASAAAPADADAPAFAATPSKPKAEATPAIRAPTFNAPKRAAKPEPTTTAPAVSTSKDDAFLDDGDTARTEARRAASKPVVMPSAQPRDPAQPAPVALSTETPAGADKPLPELAIRFMEWLQKGLEHRRIKYNESGAQVHFVPQGMALVSPVIFREFARQHPHFCEIDPEQPERIGTDVQRAVMKAGWHLPAAGGTNIHHFSVVKRGGVKVGRPLAAVVLVRPDRWVVPVPPPNPSVVPLDTEH